MPGNLHGATVAARFAAEIRHGALTRRTSGRASASDGDYNAMLMEAATIRIDMPAASTVEVIARLLDALARIETGSA